MSPFTRKWIGIVCIQLAVVFAFVIFALHAGFWPTLKAFMIVGIFGGLILVGAYFLIEKD